MPRVNPDILKWARETAGLTLEEAADKVDINAARGLSGEERLAEYEAGLTASEVGPVVSWVDADLHAWHMLRPLLDAGPYLPWSDGAMRPGGLVAVCNEIVLGGRERIVECGSGASTVLLARLLAQRGTGTLTAIEHDAGWADWVTDQLGREGLTVRARVVTAPLETDGWYERQRVAAALGDDGIDLLLVDGPPACAPGAGLARHAALASLAPLLAPGAVVVLDDAIRPGEQEVLRRWEAETPYRFELRETEAIAIGRRTARAPAPSSPQAPAGFYPRPTVPAAATPVPRRPRNDLAPVRRPRGRVVGPGRCVRRPALARRGARRAHPARPRRPGARLLDLGCGGGLLAPHVPRGLRAPRGRPQRRARSSRPRCAASRPLRADVTAVPLPDGFADVVVAGELLEHVPDVEGVISEVPRLLRPGGTADRRHDRAHAAGRRLSLVWVGERLPGGPPPRIHDPGAVRRARAGARRLRGRRDRPRAPRPPGPPARLPALPARPLARVCAWCRRAPSRRSTRAPGVKP